MQLSGNQTMDPVLSCDTGILYSNRQISSTPPLSLHCLWFPPVVLSSHHHSITQVNPHLLPTHRPTATLFHPQITDNGHI